MKLRPVIPDMEEREKEEIIRALSVNKSATKGEVQKSAAETRGYIDSEITKLWNGISQLEKALKELKKSKVGEESGNNK